MSCRRCHGLMRRIRLEDIGSTIGCWSGWQCLLCGNVTDPGIAANRKQPFDPRRNGARPPGSPPVSANRAKRKRD